MSSKSEEKTESCGCALPFVLHIRVVQILRTKTTQNRSRLVPIAALRSKPISDLYHPYETGGVRLRVRALRNDALHTGERDMSCRADAVYCVLVVAAAVLLGIVKCAACGKPEN